MNAVAEGAAPLFRRRLLSLPYRTADLVRQGIGYSRWSIRAMKLAGFEFTHGNKTTWASVLKFTADNPHFRAGDFYGRGRLSPAELAAKYPKVKLALLEGGSRRPSSARTNTLSSRPPALSGSPDETSLTHG